MSILAHKVRAQENVADNAETNDRILIVGNIARWTAQGRAAIPCGTFQFNEIEQLTATILDDAAPTMIFSPLVGDDFDVMDVVEQLSDVGFSGQYRVIADALPNPEMIRKEVRAVAPDLDFDLLMMPDAPDEA